MHTSLLLISYMCYIESSGKHVMNHGVGNTRKEVLVAYFKKISLSRGTEKTQVNLQSGKDTGPFEKEAEF